MQKYLCQAWNGSENSLACVTLPGTNCAGFSQPSQELVCVEAWESQFSVHKVSWRVRRFNDEILVLRQWTLAQHCGCFEILVFAQS